MYERFEPKLKPVPYQDKEGFYLIPNVPRYVVNTDGECYDLKRNIFVNWIEDGRGYLVASLVRDDILGSTSQHRLLGIVFLNPGIPIEKLQVNHIDGNKSNNRLTNLEWVTKAGNNQHAALLGLSTRYGGISMRNALTGVVIQYSSALECAQSIGVLKSHVFSFAHKGEDKFDENFQQFRFGHDNTPWYIPSEHELELKRVAPWKPLLVRSLITNQEWRFEKRTHASEFLGVCEAVISVWANKPDQPVLPGYFQMKTLDSSREWRYVEDPILELCLNVQQRACRVYNPTTGDVKIFPSVITCAKEMCVRPTALVFRLKSNGTKVYADGYTFQYYEDYVRENSGHVDRERSIEKLFNCRGQLHNSLYQPVQETVLGPI